VILADTSAWIEYLRRTGSPAHLRLRAAAEAGEVIAITGPVAQELLGGTDDPRELERCADMISSCRYLAIDDPDDFASAAAIYRSCRRGGATVRRQIDCLIAAVAIRERVELLHADRDYDAIALHAPLRIVGSAA
jgi:predicted nucleic acid-binding protein